MRRIDLTNCTLLLVDDKPENLDVLSSALDKAGFNLMIARNGQEVFTRIEQKRPDLILLDIMMPGMDGFEVCARLKNDTQTEDIPVIFMTALHDTVDKIKGFDLGAADYITKPFQMAEVLARVKAHLSIEKLHAQLVSAQIQQAASQMDELRSNIITRIPHELRTPLTGILGLSEFILQTYNSRKSEEILEYTTDIKNSAVRLHQYIEKYISYIEIELLASHTEQLAELRSASATNLIGIVREMAEAIAYKAKRTNDLVVELLPIKEYSLAIRIEHLQKITRVLVDNAFKFSAAGTPVKLYAQLNNGVAEFVVADQGRGWCSGKLDTIGAFNQFDRNIYEQQGAGLELASAKRLLEIYGGSLEVSSAGENKGCQAKFCLPLAQPERP